MSNYFDFVLLQATPEEINSAYRRLSRMFHPDKHSTDRPNQQKWAEQIFNKVKEAYEVLSDSHKRAIYDTLGVYSSIITLRLYARRAAWQATQRFKQAVRSHAGTPLASQ